MKSITRPNGVVGGGKGRSGTDQSDKQRLLKCTYSTGLSQVGGPLIMFR